MDNIFQNKLKRHLKSCPQNPIAIRYLIIKTNHSIDWCISHSVVLSKTNYISSGLQIQYLNEKFKHNQDNFSLV